MSTVAYADDEAAYRRLVEPHRRELHAHCYRMLGSVQDAEDALQDALLRAWRGLDRFEGRSSPRSWLYRIATNTCLDAIAKRPKRILPIDNEQPVFEGVWLEPFPDELLDDDGQAAPEARYEARESIELAFIAALQHLPANQRAVLILREVLGFSAKEVAGMLDTTPASVNSAMQRARASVDERLPERSQQETLALTRRRPDPRARRALHRRLGPWRRRRRGGDAGRGGDVLDAAQRRVVPRPRGHPRVPAARPAVDPAPLRAHPRQRPAGLRDLPARRRRVAPNAIHVITLDASGAITDAIGFLDASLFPHFGLPPTPPDAEN